MFYYWEPGTYNPSLNNHKTVIFVVIFCFVLEGFMANSCTDLQIFLNVSVIDNINVHKWSLKSLRFWEKILALIFLNKQQSIKIIFGGEFGNLKVFPVKICAYNNRILLNMMIRYYLSENPLGTQISILEEWLLWLP